MRDVTCEARAVDARASRCVACP